MSVQAYPAHTSAPQGGSLDFHLNDHAGVGLDATVVVTEFATGQEVHRETVSVDAFPTDPDPAVNRGWPVGFTLDIGANWTSGLYLADFQPGVAGEDRVFFVVRSGDPGADAQILVSLPYPTWHAYNFAGTPGASPYWNEQPDRGARVSLRRPCSVGPAWETPFLLWQPTSGIAADYCSGYDLHDGLDMLSRYQLLVIIGHDEYWTAGMRDTVEAFVRRGGNFANFSGNTCWWQFRLEDDGETYVCYRDAVQDPLAGIDNSRVTVEWSSAPVNRPENHMLGVSFRRGAGCWLDTTVMAQASWTAHATDHWVFEGTGLADGAQFGTGTIGYETDAAEIVEINGVPKATGRDGTPSDFIVLGTADLRDWRRFGQGGFATMGLFQAPGGGTVFSAASTGWSAGLKPADPAVERITRNVLTRLRQPQSANTWQPVGAADQFTAMVVCENILFATDAGDNLLAGDPRDTPVTWAQIGHANGVVAMASAREAMGGRPICLYAVADGTIWQRVPEETDVGWVAAGPAPGVIALAACYQGLFAVTDDGDLLYRDFEELASNAAWQQLGDATGVHAMAGMNGRLFAVTADERLLSRMPVLGPADWTELDSAAGPVSGLAAYAGRLFQSTTDGQLFRRDAVPTAPL